MVQLPKIAVLKSKYNNKYLRYLNDISSPVHQFLQYSSEEILTPFTTFEFEPAKSDPSLFHIRSCYNNKYWCSLPSDRHYIVAAAEQKEEDKTKWTCTLFRPVYDDKHQSFRFCHVYLGFNVVLWRVGAPYGACLRAQWSVPDRDLCDLSTVINSESLISLPKHVAFRGDNGLYLSAIDGLSYMQFLSNNIEDQRIQMETFVTKDGRARIKSIHWGKFWRRGTHNRIYADSIDTTAENIDTLFWPSKVEPTAIALRNLGNDQYVKRYTTAGIQSVLAAIIKEIDRFSHLTIIELVRSREIYDVTFHLSAARIRDEVGQVVESGTTTNNTKLPSTIDLTVSFTDTTSSTWTSSISTKLDVETTLKSEIPRILDGKKITISETKFSGKYKWGETVTTSKTGKVTYQITVPPMSTASIKVVATKGTCDIPFSYKQRDVLISGKTVEYALDDGVYCGTNYYNLSYEVDTKPI